MLDHISCIPLFNVPGIWLSVMDVEFMKYQVLNLYSMLCGAVLQSMDAEARKELTPIKLRKKAAQFALKTVNEQRKSFKVCGGTLPASDILSFSLASGKEHE